VYELEKLLSDTYTVFNEQFPEYNYLWGLLVKEEKEHADAIQKLYRLTYEGQASFEEGRLKPEGVQAVIDYVKNIYENAKMGQYNTKQAIKIAYDIEKSLIEKDIFNYFKTVPELSNTLRYLILGTKNHILLLEKEVDELN